MNNKYNFSLIKKQDIDLNDIQLISCADIKNNEKENNHKFVHFFVDDYRFNGIYDNPEKSLKRYSQYRCLLSPDFSLYSDMPLWKQLENVEKNRFCGAFWQSKGLNVIPTISWGLPISYDFCFEGIEEGSIVAISTLGCKKNKFRFLNGFNEMIRRIKPSKIICFGKPFEEMKNKVFYIDYASVRCGKIK